MRSFLNKLKNKRIYVIGLSGAEGSAAASFLIKHGFDGSTEGSDYIGKKEFRESFMKYHKGMSKKQQEDLLEKISKSDMKIYYKKDYLKNIEKADYIFLPSGWIKLGANYPRVEEIYKNQKNKILSMMKLYFELSQAKTIGVTGSNGKSTTNRLIWEMIRGIKERSYWAGNDRANIQILDKLDNMRNKDLFTIEVSDRQLLIPLKKGPNIAIILNITPNHLDDHKTFTNYIKVKKRILDCQSKRDIAILNYENGITRNLGRKAVGKVYYFSSKRILSSGSYLRGDWLILKINQKEEKIVRFKDIKIRGIHNLENLMAASLASRLAGVSLADIRKVVKSFEGIEQRTELVRSVSGINFYYDRQATTPEATISSINSFESNLVIIAGGDDKGMDYGKLSKLISKKAKYLILLPGTATKKIVKSLIDLGYNKFTVARDIKKATQKAVFIVARGDDILLSPGCVFAKHEYLGKNKKTFYDFVNEAKIK